MAKADSAKDAVQEASKHIEKAADKAARAARDETDSLLAELRPTLEALSQRVHDLTEHGKDMAADAAHQTRDTMQHAREGARDHVAERPFQSVAVAAAVGTLIGWLLSRR